MENSFCVLSVVSNILVLIFKKTQSYQIHIPEVFKQCFRGIEGVDEESHFKRVASKNRKPKLMKYMYI